MVRHHYTHKVTCGNLKQLVHPLDGAGVLAIDRAVTSKDIISREVYNSMRAHFDAQVDYHITPTI
jgi:hypothetical protein